MGASIGMAKGASEAGLKPAVAVIGDSTFLHSGMTPLVDAVSCGTAMTVLIVDNETVAMTGGQETILPSSKIKPLIEGIGVEPEHIRVLDAHRRSHEENVNVMKQEIDYDGLSVIISVRECIESAKKRKKKEGAAS
jgi:indolepyruvate ferredoxin oxidoreductase alpha subunit